MISIGRKRCKEKQFKYNIFQEITFPVYGQKRINLKI